MNPTSFTRFLTRTVTTWLLTLGTSLPMVQAGGKTQIADAGKALLPVIISEQASAGTRRVAEELALYLGRMTGGRFDVKTGDGLEGIVLGTIVEFPNPQLAAGLEIRNTYDGREAFAIRTEERRVLLIGATELGAQHAAFRLLEGLGCRWFFPAKQWEIVPSRATVSVELNETDRPAILARRIWYGYGVFKHDGEGEDFNRVWARHNRMASSFTVSCGHAWQSIIAVNKQAFAAHPEYLALVKDERKGPQFCASNPEVRKIVLDYALDQVRKRPEIDMVSLETSDGDGHCECEACQRLGSISDRVFGLANEVAKELAMKHPGKMVGLLAYNDHCEPPSFSLEPNVYVQSTAGFIRGRYTFDELMELWPKRCRNLGFYEYFSVWLWDFDMPARGRGGNLKYIREQIPRYVACGATSLDCESGCNWGPHGLGYYVANRLMWNPKVDVDALLADFFESAFGPAAAAVRRYYERLDGGNEPLISEHLLGLALRDLAEAAQLAQGHPDIFARLDQLKQYQHYVRLRWEHDRTADKDRKRDLAMAAFTHTYRTRFSYMNHWEAIRQDWTPKAAKDFDQASWSSRDASRDKPWKVESPLTAHETERLFQEDVTYFQPQNIEEKSFSHDLVRGGFEVANPVAMSQRFQGRARYVLLSAQGEPLHIDITTGTIAWYRDRPEAAYSVCDAAGTEIAKARLPQDGEKHALSIPVPKAGVYWLEFNDQTAGWAITAAPGQPVCLELHRRSALSHDGHMQRMFFYVPEGTREIVYYWDGNPHDVYGPEGQVLTSITSRGKFVHVAVPPGCDGKVWSFGRLRLGHLWFFNVPNYLAASPDGLLLPREVTAPPPAR
jgi:hypothetical protein